MPMKQRTRRRRKAENCSKNYTKKGPGRVHAEGGGKRIWPHRPDSLHGCWHLSEMAKAERVRRNKGEVI